MISRRESLSPAAFPSERNRNQTFRQTLRHSNRTELCRGKSFMKYVIACVYSWTFVGTKGFEDGFAGEIDTVFKVVTLQTFYFTYRNKEKKCS